jgi:hypothetical protein
MNKQYASGPWTITNAILRPSKYHDSNYTYITMRNEQGDIVHTNIEEDFNNNTYWKDVIQALDDNYDVIIDNIHYKIKYGKIIKDNRTGNPVVDADSKPTIKSISKNITKEAEKYQRKSFNEKKLNDLVNSGIVQVNGKWQINEYMDKDGNFHDDLNIKPEDNIDIMRDKLKAKNIIKYADMLNKGVKFND